MRASNTTQSLLTLISGIIAGYHNIAGATNSVMWSLVVIEIVLTGVWLALGHEQVAGLIKKLLTVSIWIWIIKGFPRLAQLIVESLATAGLRASGKGDNFSVLLNPSDILVQGFKTTAPFMKFLESVPWTHFPDKVTYYVCYLGIIWAYIWMAACLFYPVVEYYLFVAVGSVLMPFAVSRHTRFIADKAINMTISSGVKLLVLGFLYGVIVPTLGKIQFMPTGVFDWNELASLYLTLAALGYLLFQAPRAAASMMNGTAGLGGSEILTGLASAGFGLVTTSASRMAGTVTGGLGEIYSGATKTRGNDSGGMIGGAGALAQQAASAAFSSGGSGGDSKSKPADGDGAEGKMS